MTPDKEINRLRERLDTHDIALDAISERIEEMDQQLTEWENQQ